MGPEDELMLYDRHNSWPVIYQQLCADALRKYDFSIKDARTTEYRNRNRYRDVNPYDHSRIHLVRDNIDYINANLVESPEANRAYILTQGPLPSTCGHFWLMVWEQNSKAVLMLNRCIEKNQVKCHQYFPVGEDDDGENALIFEDVRLRIVLVSKTESNYYYAVRLLQIEDTESHEVKEVLHFHYKEWPDFGLPASAFLDFLFAVRDSGALERDVGPPVIHCSAGIGRSGTFCLVDTCLILIERNGSSRNISIRDILMDMRKYRMGLIQTSEQLRFSYLAVIDGTKRILDILPTEATGDDIDFGGTVRKRKKEVNDDDDDDWPSEPPPPPPPPRLDRAVPHEGDTREDSSVTWKRNNREISMNGEPTILPGDPTKVTVETNKTSSSSVQIRRRKPEERKKQASFDVCQMKERQEIFKSELEKNKKNSKFKMIGQLLTKIQRKPKQTTNACSIENKKHGRSEDDDNDDDDDKKIKKETGRFKMIGQYTFVGLSFLIAIGSYYFYRYYYSST